MMFKSSKSGRIYFGQTKCYRKRMNKHLSKLRRGVHDNIVLQNTFNKYGEEDMYISMRLPCSIEDLDTYEQKYIDIFPKDKLFNLNLDISREIGCERRGNHYGLPPVRYGKDHHSWGTTMSEETKAQQRITRDMTYAKNLEETGRKIKLTPKQIKARSDNFKGGNNMLHDPTIKKKLRTTKLLKKTKTIEEALRIYKLNKDEGISRSQIARDLNWTSHKNVSRVIDYVEDYLL